MMPAIIGRKIVAIRPMSRGELAWEGWDSMRGGTVIILDDGTRIIASRDDEGNGPGAFFFRR